MLSHLEKEGGGVVVWKKLVKSFLGLLSLGLHVFQWHLVLMDTAQHRVKDFFPGNKNKNILGNPGNRKANIVP